MQFSPLFDSGMRLISEGNGSPTFSASLLLPVPLLSSTNHSMAPAGVRQSVSDILSIVTALTIGHFISLTLASTGLFTC